MTGRTRRPWSLVWLAASACLFPTDRTGQIAVQVVGLPDTMLVGDTARAAASALDPAGQPVPNALIVFSSSAVDVLSVSPAGAVRALAAGTASVTASIAGQEKVNAVREVRVRPLPPLIAVDSARPRTVRFGDTLAVYVLTTDLATTTVLVGGMTAPLRRVDSLSADGRRARFVVWVPVGATERSPVTLRVGPRTTDAADTVAVIQEDLYEPNDSAPHDLGTLAQGFYNPELAVESQGRDSFKLTFAATRNRTLTFAGDAALAVSFGPDTAGGGVLVDGEFAYFAAMCHGSSDLGVPLAGDTVRVPLVALHAGSYLAAVTVMNQYPPRPRPTRYVLGIEDGIATGLPPDSLEGNDTCGAASPVTIGAGPLALNIHGTYDLDYFTFVVDTTMLVRIRADFPGPDDLNFILTGAQVYRHASGTDPTSEESVDSLPPGVYRVRLFSYYATPMPYILRIEPATAAALAAFRAAPPAPPRAETGRRHWIVQRSDSVTARP